MPYLSGIRAHNLDAKRLEVLVSKGNLMNTRDTKTQEKEAIESKLYELRVIEQEVHEEEIRLRFQAAARKARLKLVQSERSQLLRALEIAESQIEELQPEIESLDHALQGLDFIGKKLEDYVYYESEDYTKGYFTLGECCKGFWKRAKKKGFSHASCIFWRRFVLGTCIG